MKKKSIFSIILVYFLISASTLMLWEKKNINTVTGDEPHYLVMARGIAKHGSLEQTEPYKEEFRTKKIYKFGLDAQDSEPSPFNTPAVAGPHGLFNVHNIGLPLLLSIPFILGGVLGSKVFMIFCAAFIIVLGWKFSSIFSEDKNHIFWAVFATCISLPFIPASNQIYPDILAGLIALLGLYWFITVHEKRRTIHEIILTAVIVFLPWLQIKFAATCFLIIVAVAVKLYCSSKDIKRVASILLVASISFLVLAFYNCYAFGRMSGPYQSGALQLSKTSLMVLSGLFLDQNQGFLLQNPINLIGVPAIGWLYRFNRQFTVVWGLVFLSLIVPNALHPNWYGGGSFSGRFEWAAVIVFIVPTIYGLLILGRRYQKLFYTVIAISIMLQLYFFYLYALSGVQLYNKNVATWFDSYSIFYSPVYAWLPMLYNSTWAYHYIPNYAWVIFIGSLLILSFFQKKQPRSLFSYAIILAVAFFVAAGPYANHLSCERFFQANNLPSQTGRVMGTVRFAEQDIDHPGFLSYGPYISLGKGKYEVVVRYSSIGKAKELVGYFDVANARSGAIILQHPLYGTDSSVEELKIEFEVKQWTQQTLEFRNNWNGLFNLKIYDIRLKRV